MNNNPLRPALIACGIALIPSRFTEPMQTFLFRYRPDTAGGE